MGFQRPAVLESGQPSIDVSIVMPCLNEVQSLTYCITSAHGALNKMREEYGLSGEIVVADNGSTDGSQFLARQLGARVVDVERKGYGAAILGGFHEAHGRFLVMGDADGSYAFMDAVAMVGRLMNGADLCMGSRFMGGIAPGAMPWKNRYIGNPILTGILNLFFRSGIDDAHCGLRAIRREACAGLDLQGSGMEFASEMVIKASLRSLRIEQTPVRLSPDLRDRPPHLRPWRDGWRHLRYLLMLSPTWVFGVPAAVAMLLALTILGTALLHEIGVFRGPGAFGASWSIIAGFLLTTSHCAAIMAITTHLHGVKLGYRKLRPAMKLLQGVLTLEHILIGGVTLVLASLGAFGFIGWKWIAGGLTAPPSVLPVMLAAVVGTVGFQSVLGGFLMAIVAGHEARFVSSRPEVEEVRRVEVKVAA